MTDYLDLESTTNPRVKAWAALAKRSERDHTGTFLIEGARESLRAKDLLDVVEVIVCPEYVSDDVFLPTATMVSQRVFDKISRRQHPDGVALIARRPDHRIASFSPQDPALVLVADGIEKPGNIGAILRTCDSFGAAFIGSSLKTDLENPNVVRAAQGSLFSPPVATADRPEAIAWCTANTKAIVAHPEEGGKTLWDVDMTQPMSIVIGAEHEGVHQSWLEAGEHVSLPVAGTADSLNASVSAAVFLAEAVRQRSQPSTSTCGIGFSERPDTVAVEHSEDGFGCLPHIPHAGRLIEDDVHHRSTGKQRRGIRNSHFAGFLRDLLEGSLSHLVWSVTFRVFKPLRNRGRQLWIQFVDMDKSEHGVEESPPLLGCGERHKGRHRLRFDTSI